VLRQRRVDRHANRLVKTRPRRRSANRAIQISCLVLRWEQSRLAMIEFLKQRARETEEAWRRPSWGHLVVVLPWTIGVVFLTCEWVVWHNAATRQQTTFATVTAHDAANHSRYLYTFTVAGQTYDGSQIPDGAEAWTVGQQVVVYYDAADPTRNALHDFTAESDGILGPVPVLLLGIVAVIALIRSQRRKAAQRQSPG
jgi:hypothetical protein